jgi:hypothetical protein
MMEEQLTVEQEAQEALDRIAGFVVQQMQTGADKETIKVRLMANGIEEQVASEVVESIWAEATHSSGGEQLTMLSMIWAMIGGVVAAVVAGVVWGLIAVGTGYEIGWVAWGVGLLAGFGVVLFSGGQQGLPFQLVAVGAAALGIVIGKYYMFFQALKEYVGEEQGAEAVAQLSMLSAGVVAFFVQSLGSILGGFDVIWVLLAVATAWGIPKVGGMDPESAG